jgi:hypothetical protein
MLDRRRALRLIGGGFVVAAAAPGCSGASDSARGPWLHAGQYDDIRKRALSYALLAPNPHNLQPWLVKLVGDDSLALHVDLERRLPVTDPFDRQITIGCGALLELMSIAAAEEGYGVEIVAFPDGEDMRRLDRRAVARVRFVTGIATRDALFKQILARRSNKTIYQDRDVPDAALAALAGAGRVHQASSSTIGNTDLAASLRDLTWRAHVRELTTPAANQESVDLMRIGATEVAADPDGIALEGAMIEVGRRLGMVTREALADPTSSAFQQGLDLYKKMAMSARAFGWISNRNKDRTDQLKAGRAYVRANLQATALDLAIHPWSQALQEYSEMGEIYDEAHRLIGQGERVQMLYRIGYAKTIKPAPRRGLQAHLV